MRKSGSPIAFWQVLFCDDIRNEVGGKVSYMGVYKGVMRVEEAFPVTLPKFAIAVSYRQRHGEEKPVTLQIFLPGDADDKPSIEGEISGEDAEMADMPDGMIDPKKPRLTVMETGLILAPFQLAQPGMIKVRALCDGQIVHIGALCIAGANNKATGSPVA